MSDVQGPGDVLEQVKVQLADLQPGPQHGVIIQGPREVSERDADRIMQWAREQLPDHAHRVIFVSGKLDIEYLNDQQLHTMRDWIDRILAEEV